MCARGKYGEVQGKKTACVKGKKSAENITKESGEVVTEPILNKMYNNPRRQAVAGDIYQDMLQNVLHQLIRVWNCIIQVRKGSYAFRAVQDL